MNSNDEFKPSHSAVNISYHENSYEVCRSKIIEELIPLGHGDSAVDVGCGHGYFSKMLSAHDWRTTAIDTDSKNIDSAARYAIETHVGDANSVLMKLPDDQYGLVLALEIIEHMPKTHGEYLLKQILRVLRPNGRLIISTPNRISLEGLVGYYWRERLRGEKKWNAWAPDHVYLYSSPEILRLVRTIGFTVDKITGFHYKARLPLIGHCGLPIERSTIFPLNRIGFNITLECHK